MEALVALQQPEEADNNSTTTGMDMPSRQDDSEPDMNLYQAVLMDHEYELYRPWNDFMDGIIYPDVIDQANSTEIIDTDVQNEVEIEQESWISHHNHDEVHQRNGIDLEIPPSPATASLQDLLQQAYRETQVEAHDIIPYEDYRATIMNEQRDGRDFNLDVLDDMETIISSPHQVGPSEIASITTNSEPFNSSESIGYGLCQASSSLPCEKTGQDGSSSRSNSRKNLIENSTERSQRFRSGLKYIETKVKRMRMRTGATASGIAEYEGDQYSFETCSNSFRSLNEIWEKLPGVDSILSEIPSNGDDHRYAAQIVTQSSSSVTVSDHQYGHSGSGSRLVTNLNQEMNKSPGSLQTNSKPTFERRTYERNKSFQRHVDVLFSEVVKKLEEQTGAIISLSVMYQNEVFTKLNYEDVCHIFGKRKRNGPSLSPVPVAKISRKYSSKGSSSSSNVQEISPPGTSYNLCPPIVPLVTNTKPLCLKCHSPTLLTDFGKTDDGFTAWVRCADPLCSYLVHAACLGFRVTSKKSLRGLPPFFCEAHQD